MRKLVLGFVVFVAAMLMAGPVSAGGWAVTTLDSVPAPEAGETVEIGFTIRQHGVTPVNPDGDIGVVLRSESGGERYFPAEPVGDVGYHVATVTFPDDGTWSWAVRQGWFAEQALGVVELGPRSAQPVDGYRWPIWIRLGLPALALAFAAGAVLEAARDRWRGQRVPAA